MLQVRLRQAGPIPLDVAFSCASGETLALVGPSGSGKTTILKAIAGLYRVAHAQIEVARAQWTDTAASVFKTTRERRVGFVFQSYALFPHLSVIENVMEASASLGPARRTRAQEMLAAVNLAGLEDRLPRTLSGGQQQRVALARALAREPDVLLLDEPFSAVDQVTREKLYEELANLRRQLRMPVVLVTHSLHEAALLADRMCVLHHGHTLQTGAPHEVLTRPDSVDVARLVSLKNVFEGRVLAQNEAAGHTLIDWNGLTLEARYQPAAAVGARVSWVVPAAFVLLHRRDRPSRGDRENPVRCTVRRQVVMGENVVLTLSPAHAAGESLSLTVSAHVAQRNGIAEGVAAAVSLLAEGIHFLQPSAAEAGPGTIQPSTESSR